MELSPLLMYESFILATGVAAIIAFAIFYFRLLRGYNKLRLDHEKLTKELDEYGNVLTATSKDQLQKLIAHSDELSAELKNKLSSLLESQAQKESGAYEQVVKQVGDSLQKESLTQVQAFATSLSKEVAASETQIREQIAGLYDETRQETKKIQDDVSSQIHEMQKEAKKELTEHIYQIVEAVVQASTGKLLSRQDSEGIVLAELEKSLKSSGLGGQ